MVLRKECKDKDKQESKLLVALVKPMPFALRITIAAKSNPDPNGSHRGALSSGFVSLKCHMLPSRNKRLNFRSDSS